MLVTKTVYGIEGQFNNIHQNKISNKKNDTAYIFIFTDGIFTNAESTHALVIYIY